MRGYILSERERRMLQRFLEADEKSETFRMLKMRILRNHDRLTQDLKLIEKALKKMRQPQFNRGEKRRGK